MSRRFQTSIWLPELAGDPATPSEGLEFYALRMGGRRLPKVIGPSGVETALETSLHANSKFFAFPGNGTSYGVLGGAVTNTGTISHQQTVGNASRWQRTRRTRIQTSSTAAGTVAGARTAYGQWYLGNQAGDGGFFFRSQFGQNINLNGGQVFIGLCVSTGTLGGDPSALLHMVGVGYDAADASTGNWQLMHNDGSGVATKIDLGSNMARGTTHGYDLIIFAAPNSSVINVFIRNLDTGTIVYDNQLSTNIPAVNTALALKAEARNGTQTANVNIEFAKLYVESDY